MWFPEGLENTPLKSCKPHEKTKQKHQNARFFGEKLKECDDLCFIFCKILNFDM
jgi:hypothetical protein